MPQFVLIDHSLRGVGGHHYEYAVHVLKEAEAEGFAIVLATHRRFRGHSHVPASWTVMPIFKHHTYNPHAFSPEHLPPSAALRLGNAGPSSAPGRPESVVFPHDPAPALRAMLATALSRLVPIRDVFRRRNRQRRLAGFVKSCQHVLRNVSLQDGDVVFVPTLSPFDLQGLSACWARTPETSRAIWHLQFQFDLLDRSATDGRNQQRVTALRGQCQAALARAPHHRIFFYTTTDRLATQYRQLAIGEVRELSYPVNPSLHTKQITSSSRPLRITCAGGMRREKGSHELAGVIRELWHPYVASGRCRLQIQASRRQFHRLLSRTKAQLQREAADSKRGAPGLEGLVRIKQPLPMEAYRQLIRDTDIGLLLYDRDSYYARCSGVLVEMLAAGVPVIVPAACWLADQLAEPTFHYHDQVEQDAAWVDRIKLKTTACRRGGPAGTARVVTEEIALPPHVTAAITRFRHRGRSRDPYVTLCTQHLDDAGSLLYARDTTVGTRVNGQPASVLTPISGRTAKLVMSWTHVDDDEQPNLRDVEISLLASDPQRGPVDPDRRYACPTGAVGLTASRTADIPRLIAEMIENFAHYRATAAAFSSPWVARHSPEQVLRTLLARQEGLRSEAVATEAATEAA